MKWKFVCLSFSAACLTGAVLILLTHYSKTGPSELPYFGLTENTRLITDAAGREVLIPKEVERVICSGSGTLRLLTYLQAENSIVGVDSIEKRGSVIDTRPYAVANPQFSDYPQFGEFRGYDSPERILGLCPAPQVIFKTSDAGGDSPERLQEKTGIPVVTIDYGHITRRREALYNSLNLMAEVVKREERAAEVIEFFEGLIDDLGRRTSDIPEDERPSCYVGGIAMRGPHGFHSTELAYPPFEFADANNTAGDFAKSYGGSHASISKEQIVAWDPDILFVDISTIRLGEGAGAVNELLTDPAYRNMTAVRKGLVYGVLPYNSYNANFGSIFANAYFIGKVLYPQNFSDICPVEKADEIYGFLLGEALFENLNSAFNAMALTQLVLDEKVIHNK